MTFQIDRAHVRDISRVKPLWKQMVNDYASISGRVWRVLEPSEAWQRRLQEYLSWINEASGVIFIATQQAPAASTDAGEPADPAEPEEKVVGYAALRFVTSGSTFDTGETHGELESLVVLPEARGEGIGYALMMACRKELQRREIDHWSMSTLADNDAALALARKAGFSPFMIRMAQRLDED
ncbi:MAG: GNAT family N-acetyltransferase [Dermatophilus congolensis]|nr:GNAT family N-acetyltransferase [Dermatophilus congolensis]